MVIFTMMTSCRILLRMDGMKGLQLKMNGEELIFDNIHPEGIPQQEWLGKFYCLALDLGRSISD